jgi:hypothetical protein
MPCRVSHKRVRAWAYGGANRSIGLRAPCHHVSCGGPLSLLHHEAVSAATARRTSSAPPARACLAIPNPPPPPAPPPVRNPAPPDSPLPHHHPCAASTTPIRDLTAASAAEPSHIRKTHPARANCAQVGADPRTVGEKAEQGRGKALQVGETLRTVRGRERRFGCFPPRVRANASAERGNGPESHRVGGSSRTDRNRDTGRPCDWSLARDGVLYTTGSGWASTSVAASGGASKARKSRTSGLRAWRSATRARPTPQPQ